MEECVFCKIATGQLPAKRIYEDEDVMAFHDIHPSAPIHFLIIPKQHIPTLSDCTEKESLLLGKMLLLAPKLTQEQGCGYKINASGIAEGGYKVLFNTGPAGGQEVYHLHIHIMSGTQPRP